MCLLCISCFKMNKLGCLDKYMQIITQGGEFCNFFLDYKVELYFKISNHEIRSQILMISWLTTQIVFSKEDLDCAVFTGVTDVSHTVLTLVFSELHT